MRQKLRMVKRPLRTRSKQCVIQKEQGNKSIMPVRIKRQKGQVGDPVASQIHITPF